MATLLCRRTACLHSGGSVSHTFIVPASVKATFHTVARTQASRPSQLSSSASSTSIRVRATLSGALGTTIPARCASVGRATTAPQATSSQDALTWDRFFDLRRRRRWLNLGTSLVTAIASVGIFAPMLAQYDFDTWGAQTFGIDPVFVLGISTFAVAGAGWLLGPVFGNSGFAFWAGRRGWSKLIAEKEKTFYARIKRYRADASSSSPQNPIPDYYGEKIGSVKDYRRWLKDQRAFSLKVNKNMI